MKIGIIIYVRRIQTGKISFDVYSNISILFVRKISKSEFTIAKLILYIPKFFRIRLSFGRDFVPRLKNVC